MVIVIFSNVFVIKCNFYINTCLMLLNNFVDPTKTNLFSEFNQNIFWSQANVINKMILYHVNRAIDSKLS